MLATYDVPVGSIKKREPSRGVFAYLVSLSIPQGLVQGASSDLAVHSLPQMPNRPETLS